MNKTLNEICSFLLIRTNGASNIRRRENERVVKSSQLVQLCQERIHHLATVSRHPERH